jgi:bifunctional non-homologous end joining protein LigD
VAQIGALDPPRVGIRPILSYFRRVPMQKFQFPRAAIAAEIPRHVRLQIVTPSAEPPAGEGWLHEIKHDGHRLVAIVDGESLKLLSRNGYDRAALFREPFRPLAGAGLPPIVLDGEIAVPDDRGVAHIDALSEAISFRRPERFAYFAFDLLHLNGHDLRRCPLEDRKAILRDVIGAARCERIVYVDHVGGIGRQVFEAVRQVGAEGIVSKRSGSIYRGGESRDWIKAKVFATGAFVVTAFGELGDGRLEAPYVAEARAGKLVPVGSVKFGLSGKGLRNRLDALRSGLARSGFVPVRPELVTRVKYFGRYRRGWIRDGVLLSVERAALQDLATRRGPFSGTGCCDERAEDVGGFCRVVRGSIILAKDLIVQSAVPSLPSSLSERGS